MYKETNTMKQSELIQEITTINNTLVTVTSSQDLQDRLVVTYLVEGTNSSMNEAKNLLNASKTPFMRVIGGYSFQITTYRSIIGQDL
jgi:predicted transcriptional regulator